MSESTKIEWCDSTFNPWIGCTKISPACDNCYAAVSTPSRTMGVEWGVGQKRHRTSDSNWKLPLRWNEMAKQKRFVQCGQCGLREFRKLTRAGLDCCSNCNAMPESESAPVRPRVFCSSLADVFDNEVDPRWRADLFSLICRTPHLDWLLLTKRIGNALEMINQAINDTDAGIAMVSDWPWRNVWIGATVCNQEEADRDIPKLLQVPARVRFLSIEPMLGPIDLESAWYGDSALEGECWGDCEWCNKGRPALHNCAANRQTEAVRLKGRSGLDWVICGGESGHNARPMHPDWVRSLRDQCAGASVPFLFKQWGSNSFVARPTNTWWNRDPDGWMDASGAIAAEEEALASGRDWQGFWRADKRLAGNLLDGRQHLEWPQGMQP